MKIKKEAYNYSGPDRNDEFMRSIGFSRDPVYDIVDYNSTDTITYWIHTKGCRIITEKKVKLIRPEIIDLIIKQVEQQTREKIRKSI